MYKKIQDLHSKFKLNVEIIHVFQISVTMETLLKYPLLNQCFSFS